MKGRLSRVIFWALIGTSIVTASWFFAATTHEFARGSHFIIFLASSGTVLFSLGIALILLTVKEKARGMLRKFLILTGASAVGIPLSIVLHNAVYGILIYWFGADFWDRTGAGDEPFFFIMGIIICPLGFLVGAVGSIVLAIRQPD